MLVNLVAVFLAVSILFYCVFAGADFGAGIVEWLLRKKNRREVSKIIQRTLGPVWEANHVWLILAVVILFNGFPKIYSALSITYHIPLTLMLVGIILRGCAFTFRHYDAVKDKDSQRWYTTLFEFSSFLTPLMLGTMAGAVLLARPIGSNATFMEGYVWPWLNWFSLTVGIFTCVLFAFLASSYLIGETEEAELKQHFVNTAFKLNLAGVLSGLSVFVFAYLEGFSLVRLFLNNTFSWGAMTLSTLLLWPLWLSFRGRKVWFTRMLAALQVGCILIGWFDLQFPVVLSQGVGLSEPLTLQNTAAPETTMRFLAYALCAGCALIFPFLIWLLKIFQSDHRSTG